MKEIIIILVNYKCKDYIADSLDSIFNSYGINTEFKLSIVIVNNSARYESIAEFENKWSNVKCLDLDSNIGFGAANNYAYEYTKSTGCRPDYIMLLNADTILDTCMIDKLLGNISDREENILVPAIYEDVECNKEWYYGGKIDYKQGCIDQLFLHNSSVNEKINFATGCCILIPYNLIEKFGLFSEDYCLYWEDVDLCAKWDRNNIKIKFVSDAKLWHRVGGSSINNVGLKLYYGVRNRIIFMDRYSNLSLEDFNKIMINYRVPLEKEMGNIVIKAAERDFIEGNFGKGLYGSLILEKGFYPLSGVYTPEKLSDEKYFCRCSSTKIVIALVNTYDKNVSRIYFFSLMRRIDQYGDLFGKVLIDCDVVDCNLNDEVSIDVEIEPLGIRILSIYLNIDDYKDKTIELTDLHYTNRN